MGEPTCEHLGEQRKPITMGRTRTDSTRGLLRSWRAIAMGASGLLVGGMLVAGGVLTAPPAVAAVNDPISCGQVYALDQSPDANGEHSIYSMNTATGALTRNNTLTYPGFSITLWRSTATQDCSGSPHRRWASRPAT